MAQPLPKPGPRAAIRALGIAARRRRARHNAAEDVAGAAAADADRRGLLADLGALELLVEGESRALRRGVDVAGAAAARVEARGAGGSGDGRAGGHAGGWGGLGSAEEVAGAAAAGVGVGVLEHGGVRLGDGVGGHFGGGWGVVAESGFGGDGGRWCLWCFVLFCLLGSGRRRWGGGGICLVWLLAGGRGKSLVYECHDGLDILVAGGGGTGQALL